MRMFHLALPRQTLLFCSIIKVFFFCFFIVAAENSTRDGV